MSFCKIQTKYKIFHILTKSIGQYMDEPFWNLFRVEPQCIFRQYNGMCSVDEPPLYGTIRTISKS